MKGKTVNGFCLKYLFSRISCVGDTGCKVYDSFNNVHYQLRQPQDFCCGIVERLRYRFDNLQRVVLFEITRDIWLLQKNSPKHKPLNQSRNYQKLEKKTVYAKYLFAKMIDSN